MVNMENMSKYNKICQTNSIIITIGRTLTIGRIILLHIIVETENYPLNSKYLNITYNT